MNMMNLRPVTIGDLGLLRHWDEQPHVIAAANDDWGWEVELNRFPDWRDQLIAELDGRPIGFVQIIDPAGEESHYWARRPEDCAPSTFGSAKRMSLERAMEQQ
jgi:aminoglycoside 6'-N-acetyltransferase